MSKAKRTSKPASDSAHGVLSAWRQRLIATDGRELALYLKKAIRDPFLLKDEQGRIVGLNDPASRLFGLSQEEAANKLLQQFLPGDVALLIAQNDKTAKESNEIHTCFESIPVNGRSVQFEAERTILSNTPFRMLTIYRQTPEAYDKKPELPVDIIEAINQAAVVFEARYEASGAIRHFFLRSANMAAYRVLDVLPGQIEGKTIQQLNHFFSGISQEEFTSLLKGGPGHQRKMQFVSPQEETLEAVIFALQSDMLLLLIDPPKNQITAPKAAPPLLKEEQRILNALNDGLWEWEIPGGNFFFNRFCFEILGHDAPITTGDWFSLHQPGQNKALRKLFEEFRRNPEPGNTKEVVLNHKNGYDLWIVITVRIIDRDSSGKPTFLAGTMSNITTIRKAEKALRESRAQLRSILDNIPHIAWLKNNAGMYMAVNKPFADAMGLEICQILGKTDQELFPPEVAEKIAQEDRYVIKNKLQINQEEWVAYFPNAGWYETYKKPVFNELNEIEGVTGIMQNISHRKSMQESILAKSEEQRILLSLIPAFVFYKDMDLRYVLVNKALALYFNTTPEDMMGKRDDSFFPPELARHFAETDRYILQKGEPVLNDISAHTLRDGTLNWFATSKVPYYDQDGRIKGVVGIVRDITELKNKEHELIRAKERAEAADVLKSTFLANLSHEIRTPLNAIIGFSQLLNEETLSDEGAEYLDLIIDSGEHLLSIINDIIDISKLEAGLMEVKGSDFDLHDLLNEASERFKRIAEKKGSVRLIVEKNETLPPIVRTDRKRLKQIIANLVDNALKFTKEGYVVIGYRMFDAAHLLFYVQDTGIGMKSDKVEMIFDRFSQADGSITREYGGTGLGLAICRGMIELLGGEIWVESTEEKGSTFYFTLPYNTGKQLPEIKQTDAGIPEWSKKTLVVIDSNTHTYQNYLMALKPTGITILHARSEHEALSFFDWISNIDLAIVDLEMHEGALSLINMLRERKPQTRFIGEYSFSKTALKEAFTGICHGYLLKPPHKDVIIAQLSRFLD